jgi:CheY-like chemotaxis protein
MPGYRKRNILIADDEPGHCHLLEKNLRKAGIVDRIMWFKNGTGLIDFLFSQSLQASINKKEKYILILDLNMPDIDGFEILEKLRADEQFKKMPVIILSTSSLPADINKAYELGCSSFITKPIDYDEFISSVWTMANYINEIKVPAINSL